MLAYSYTQPWRILLLSPDSFKQTFISPAFLQRIPAHIWAQVLIKHTAIIPEIRVKLRLQNTRK